MENKVLQRSKNMEPLINQKKRSSNLTGLVKDLTGTLPKTPAEFSQNLYTSLTTLQPDQSQTTRLITYALIATAVVGIAVYHYIRESERAEELLQEIKKDG